MATAEVQHAIPAAGVVHDDGSCFGEEGSHKDAAAAAAARDNMMNSTEEQQQAVGNNGVGSKKEEAPKGHMEGSKQRQQEDDSGDRVLEAVAQEIEAKLGIVQHQQGVVADPAPAAMIAAHEAKPAVGEERRGRRGVTKKAKAVVVVPVDDDDDIDGEAAEPAPEEVAPSSEAPGDEGKALAAGREESKGEEAPAEEGKAHEE